MPTQVQFRRGTTAQNNSFIGAAGELSINTSNNTIRVHDGSTVGGFELSRSGNVTSLLTSTSSQLASIISDETGSGSLVFATSPTLVTPDLGTPSAVVLTSGTGLPLTTGITGTLPVGNGGTGVTASTGTGNVVLSTSPVLTTPALGTPSAIVLTNATGTASNLTANIANFISISDDTTTNATRYPIFANGTSGAVIEQVSSTKLFFNPSTGLLTSTDYNSSSDKRLKKNIKTVENAVETIQSLRGVTFNWIEGSSKGIGLIAQEVEKIIPDVVTSDENGYMGIKYTNIIGILVEAIKDQQEQINTLRKQIEKP